MAKLSTAAWIAHDVGLATAIGGTMFGRGAFQPALREVSERRERDQVADAAWRRFSWINLAGHATVAATWFFGRSLLSGRSVSPTVEILGERRHGRSSSSIAEDRAQAVLLPSSSSRGWRPGRWICCARCEPSGRRSRRPGTVCSSRIWLATPEQREGPLSWGLRYYVRGDLVFDDDSVGTLDELLRC